jgi:hypothetical protein
MEVIFCSPSSESEILILKSLKLEPFMPEPAVNDSAHCLLFSSDKILPGPSWPIK